MSVEIKNVEALISSLFGESGLITESGVKACEAIVNLPEFGSFSSEQQKLVFALGLELEGNVFSSIRGFQFDRERLEYQIRLVLKTAESIGCFLTERVVEVAIKTAEKRWGEGKSE